MDPHYGDWADIGLKHIIYRKDIIKHRSTKMAGLKRMSYVYA